MSTTLLNWEREFAQVLQRKALAEGSKAGALLPIVPDHTEWDHFAASVKAEWSDWRNSLWQHPACLILLYCGLAFYEYDDNTFWPQFARTVGTGPLPPNQQQEINAAFARAAQYFGLKLRSRGIGTDFVGSAVHHIGIPLSLWDGFLDICEWALWRKDWRTLSGEEWAGAVEKRSGGRQRLKRFLIGNRESASSLIQDILDVRQIISADPSSSISDIVQASILRGEYIDEVPETAEFLRPQNPDSLFQDRARLVWDEQRQQISIQLPPVKREKLPAKWTVRSHSQIAAPTSDVLVINSAAFSSSLLLTLECGKHSESQRLHGPEPWGLFDTDNGGRFTHSHREQLPLRSYVLVSQKEIDFLSLEGFDEEENTTNERFELADGATCFVTRLWPTGKFAELRFRDGDRSIKIIRFKTRAKIEARFFAGRGERAAYFGRVGENTIKIEEWPVLCVSIPMGYFRDSKAELDNRFAVFIDDKQTSGQWEASAMKGADDREFYSWRWSGVRPVMEQIKSGTARSLQELRRFFNTPSLKGDRLLSIKSPEFTVHYKIYKDEPKPGMGECWTNLPGAYLPMFLLCQTTRGMKWEDLVLAKDVIAPDLPLSYYQLRRYAEHGFLVQRGHRWFIRESRAMFKTLDRDQCRLNYCGDPSILWGLYRRMYYQKLVDHLPVIQVIDERGEIPYLQMAWPLRLRGELEKYLRHQDVLIGAILWTH